MSWSSLTTHRIGEKMTIWSDNPPSLEDILTNVSLYWFTGSYPTSIWVYRGSLVDNSPDNIYTGSVARMKKPLGASWFPKDVSVPPKSWIDATGKFTFLRQHERGGHFAAMEVPDVLWRDVEEFAKEVFGRRV
jgi:microsomal epoxide hydrolase